MACRFPGANDTDEFWKLLEEGECHIKEIPDERWIIDQVDVQDEDSWKPCAKRAGIINEWDKWDNKFFGVSDTEASWMNPQQCLAIEVTHSALENAGYTKEKIKGTRTGVYIGAMNDDFFGGLTYARNEFNNFLVTGIAGSITANRISYYYDLRGPSLLLDTACSSALVATHLGCQAIRSGECDMVICGGVNSILTPMKFIALSKAKMISPTGLSHTFSDKADGYARGEGCGILVLKNLTKARRDGDNILAVLGTACNQDGQTNVPITAPSSDQQIYLFSEVYRQYKIAPGSLQYIEAHGTGTPTGDQIEMKALSAFVGPHLKSGTTVPVGSVKTNIGHLESAAGAAGVIKVLLMMINGKIIPSLHYNEKCGNPGIDFKNIPLVVATSVTDWKANAENKRIACVNSFGFGGTNSHAILVQKSKKHHTKYQTTGYFIVCVTGTSIPAVKKTSKHMRNKLQNMDYSIRDLSYTSLIRRDHYRYRMAYVGGSKEEIITEIDRSMENIEKLEASDKQEKHLVFLFCGVGTIWKGTCREMYKTNALFRNKFDQIDKELKGYNATISLAKDIENLDSNLVQDSFKGPLIIFACQVSIFHVWKTLGISPDTIIGQSVGEVAAAHAAGCISLEDAVKIIYHRSLLTSQTQKGIMMVIGKCDVKEIGKLCEEKNRQICIAVYSSKEACVVSGSEKGVLQLKDELQKVQPNLILKVLDVSCAYHSSFMDSVSKQLPQKLQGLKGSKPKTHLFSTVTGQRVTDDLMGTAEYWFRNLREPVLLKDSVSMSMLNDRKNIILEVGPKPVIRAHLKNITHLPAVSIASLDQQNELRTFVTAIAELFRYCYLVDYKLFFFDGSELLTDIPRYQFNRSGVLFKSDSVRNCLKGFPETTDGHPFVFHKQSSSSDFKIDLFPLKTPFVFEHIVEGRNIAPGALNAEIGLFIARSMLNVPISQIKLSLDFLKPLRVGNQGVSLQALFNEGESTINIKRLEDVICRVNIERIPEKATQKVNTIELKQKCDTHVESNEFYQTLKSHGFQYGRSLTLVGNCWRSRNEYIAEINFSDERHGSFDHFNLHPAILDGALQTIALAFLSKEDTDRSSIQENSRWIPVKLKSVIVLKEPQREMMVVGQLVKHTDMILEMNLLIVDKNGYVVVEIEGYEVQNIRHTAQIRLLKDKLYKLNWKQIELHSEMSYDNHKSREMSYDNHKSLAITFTDKESDLFTKSFPTSVLNIASVSFKPNVKGEEFWKDVLQSIHSVCGSLFNVSEILYYPGLHINDAGEDANLMFAMVKTSCLVLTFLIQHLLKEGIDIPLYLTTKQCQPHLEVRSVDCTADVIGSELWGMGRCLLRERTFTQIRLIDFNDNSDVHLIQYIVFASDSDVWRTSTEYRLQKGCIYINQIVRYRSEMPFLRQALYNSEDLVELRSKVPTGLEKPFFVPVDSEIFHLVNSNCLRIQVSNSYTNNTWIPAFSGNFSETNPWSLFAKDGFQIFPTEIEGTVIPLGTFHNSSPSSKIAPAGKSIEQKEVITCYQTPCTNYVAVPEDCVIEKTLIPWYKPCSLMEIIMSFELIEKTSSNLPIAILHDKNLQIDIFVLKRIAERLKRNIAFVETIGHTSDQLYNARVQLVILSKDESHFLGTLKQTTMDKVEILSLSCFMTKPLERHIRRSYPRCTLTLINADEILSHEKLSISMKRIRSLLKSKGMIKQTSSESSDRNQNITGICFNSKTEINSLQIASDIPVATTVKRLFSPNSTYVVVGGLTGLGWIIVEHIAEKGGGVIAILSRRSPTDELKQKISLLMSNNKCIIDSIQADVSETESVVKAFNYLKTSYPQNKIRGIFHGAAIVDDSIITKMTEDKFDRVLRPKVLGTWNLHQVSRNLKLDYFVLHSSITAVFGNSGQTNYGAGNSFKDAMSFYRRSIGMSAQTINWGPLKPGLLETNEDVGKHLNKQGYISLSESEIIECFEHSLLSNDVQVLCAMFDWKTVVRQSPDMIHWTSRIKSILEESNLVDIVITTQNALTSVDLEELLKMTKEKQKMKIEEVITPIVADVCAVESSALNPSTKLQFIGMDSMKGMAFIDAVYEYVGCRISVLSVLEETSTIATVAEQILEQLHQRGEKTGYVPV